MKLFTKIGLAVAVLLASAAPANASYIFGFSGSGDQLLTVTTTTGVFNINTFDTGWYNSSGSHTPTNTNYIICIVDSDCGSGGETHDFFGFRLGTIGGTLLSATLTAFNPANGANTTAEVSLWDFAGNLDNLFAGTGGIGAYTDLGSGVLYGSRIVGPGDNGTNVIFNLNGAALAAISAALNQNGGSGFLVIGGAGSTAAVPEPVTLTLVGLGVGAGLVRRKFAKQ